MDPKANPGNTISQIKAFFTGKTTPPAPATHTAARPARNWNDPQQAYTTRKPIGIPAKDLPRGILHAEPRITLDPARGQHDRDQQEAGDRATTDDLAAPAGD
jgi:hypothetical protein